jgi:hypothetical protein
MGFRKIAPRGSVNPTGHLVTGPMSMNLRSCECVNSCKAGIQLQLESRLAAWQKHVASVLDRQSELAPVRTKVFSSHAHDNVPVCPLQFTPRDLRCCC